MAFNTTVWLYPEEIVVEKGHRLGFAVSAELPAWIELSPFAGALYHVKLGASGTTLHLLARADSAQAMQDALSGATPSASAPDPTLEILK